MHDFRLKRKKKNNTFTTGSFPLTTKFGSEDQAYHGQSFIQSMHGGGENRRTYPTPQCSGVANYRVKYLGVPRSLPEVLEKHKKGLSPAPTTRKIGVWTSSCGQ
ncbi:uncharacterized protein LOC113232797 [Hyposmocoma kahamanoa]|uniref:uncharacterized protein LOC113232797 n=1 Tax=Hyposmocoma kahamanoa TaxID=1477025 RepID=UPI000E6D7A28|nr:uncharacterized protein LOC113232797 [Hyposmocoma kahamanoa]